MSISCHNCGHVFFGHKSLVGRICIKCGAFIPPKEEMPIIKENKAKKAALFIEALKLIERKNADFNREKKS